MSDFLSRAAERRKAILAIARRAAERGVLLPKARDMVPLLGCGENNVKAHIRWLRNRGLLQTKAGQYGRLRVLYVEPLEPKKEAGDTLQSIAGGQE